MKYTVLGKTGLTISRITYGGIVSTMGDYSHYTFEGDGQKASDEYVRFALDAGITYFDVAPSYGDAQERLGNSLIGARDRIVLACKTRYRDYDTAARDAERSLKLLHTDHFDVYQMHAICNTADVERAFQPDGVMKLMEELKRSGTARNIGITAHSEKAAVMAMGLYDFDTLLFPTNWHMNMAIGYGSKALETARSKNMGVIAMKSMIERAFLKDDVEARKRWPKSWCKPFDPDTQGELLVAAMKYAVSMGIDTLVPAGDIDHFHFAMAHENEIWNDPLTEEEKAMLAQHLESVKDHLFMPERDR
ncbi:MAG: aldo/keto reductase [Firmicutes bacterium]|nr:aldo/keto reductase [Bacillota bacterium]